MSRKRTGPGVGTEGTCKGCGCTYIRTSPGQEWHSARCYRLTGTWRWSAIWTSRGPKGENDRHFDTVQPELRRSY